MASATSSAASDMPLASSSPRPQLAEAAPAWDRDGAASVLTDTGSLPFTRDWSLASQSDLFERGEEPSADAMEDTPQTSAFRGFLLQGPAGGALTELFERTAVAGDGMAATLRASAPRATLQVAPPVPPAQHARDTPVSAGHPTVMAPGIAGGISADSMRVTLPISLRPPAPRPSTGPLSGVAVPAAARRPEAAVRPLHETVTSPGRTCAAGAGAGQGVVTPTSTATLFATERRYVGTPASTPTAAPAWPTNAGSGPAGSTRPTRRGHLPVTRYVLDFCTAVERKTAHWADVGDRFSFIVHDEVRFCNLLAEKAAELQYKKSMTWTSFLRVCSSYCMSRDSKSARHPGSMQFFSKTFTAEGNAETDAAVRSKRKSRKKRNDAQH